MSFEHLFAFNLSGGSHENAEQGVCAMEAVAWLEGLPHSDSPKCTCPVIAAYVRDLNDFLPKRERQKLVPYLPRLVGTVSKEHEQERAKFLAWRAIRVFAPAALRAAGFEAKAKTLERQNGALKDAASAAASAAAHAAARAAASAAADAAHAADAAARAVAHAAHAADAAADAAALAAVWKCAFDALDGVLAIGPQSPGFSKNTEQRVKAYREVVSTKGQ